MSPASRAVALRRLLDAGIGLCVLAVLAVLLFGGFRANGLGVGISLTHLSNPLCVLALLGVLRLAASRRWRALLLVVSAAFAVGLLEAGARAIAYLGPPGDATLRDRAEEVTAPPPGGETKLHGLLRKSAAPGLVYELVPGLETTFVDQPLAINRYGFRGPAYSPALKGDAIRIVGLGDSVMFGWGVGEGDPYLEQVERRLASAHPDRRWQIINGAVPGYNTCMEVAALRFRLLRYDPDLVVMGFVGNDLQLPNYLLERVSPFSTHRSFLLSLIESRLDHVAWDPLHRLIDSPSDPFRPDLFESDPERVPPEYRDLVGLGSYRRCMSELGDLAAERDFDVLVFAAGSLPLPVAAVCRELGFPVLEMRLWEWGRSERAHESADPAAAEAQGRVDAYLRATGIGSYLGSPLAAPDDAHPSALGHEALALGLLTYLDARGMLEDRGRGPDPSP